MATAARSDPYTYPSIRDVQAYAASVRNIGGMPGSSPSSPINTSAMGAPTAYPVKPHLKLRNNGQILIAGVADAAVLFPPLNPLQPIGQAPNQAVIGRPWDYPVGYNTRVTPRTGQPTTFSQLRALARYDIVRLMIERVKDKITTKPWGILPKDKKKKKDARCLKVEADLQFPDKMHTWADWSRMVVDQLIVYDAPSFYLRPTMAGDLYSIEVIDGSMITPKIMADGRLPPWDMGPAYQQVLQRGLPAVDYVQPVPIGMPVPRDGNGYPMPELLYKPRNPRVDNPYGYGPIEQMIASIQIGMGREQYLEDYYKYGSTPDLIFSCPPTWTTDQIVEFKLNWDALLGGNLANRRGAQFVPADVKAFDTKEKALTDQTDEWLVRIFCFALGLNPMPFIKQMNRGQEKTHHDEAAEEGQAPWQHYFVDLFNVLIPLKWGFADLEFRWIEESETDPTAQATIDVQMVTAKIYHPDEIRAQRGDDPMPDDMRAEMDLATFSSAVNSTVLPDDQQEAQNQHALDMQAAKPAPIVADPKAAASEAKKWDEFVALLSKRDSQQIHVAAPTVNVQPANVEVHPAAITVNTPEIKMGDTFVDTGSTNVKVDQPKVEKPSGKTVTAVRNADGSFTGTITDGAEKTKTIVATTGADGKRIVKIQE